MIDVIKESVLLVGDTNVGKTSMFIQMALENPTQPFFIYDTQGKIKPAARMFGGVPSNITVAHTPDLATMQEFANSTVYPTLKGQPEGYGVVCIDMAGEVWTQAQEYLADLRAPGEEGLGNNLNAQREALVKAGKDAAAGGFDGFQGHWQTIKGWYNHIVRQALFQYNSHVVITAGARDLRQLENQGRVNPKADQAEYLQVWNTFGSGPDSEKNLTFWVNTAMGIERTPDIVPNFNLSILKDMSRTPVPFQLVLRKKMSKDDSGYFNVWHEYVDVTPGVDTYKWENPHDEKI